MVDANPRLPLQEITAEANVGLGHSTVDQIIREAKFRLVVPRKKPFWRGGQKEKRKDFSLRRRRWPKSAWGRIVFIDECTIEYDPFLQERRFASGRGRS